jgi:hypothetical protein
MALTHMDNREFARSLGTTLAHACEGVLEEAVEYLRKNAKPEDVFDEVDLVKWAREYVIPADLETEALEEWAADNGWTKEE